MCVCYFLASRPTAAYICRPLFLSPFVSIFFPIIPSPLLWWLQWLLYFNASPCFLLCSLLPLSDSLSKTHCIICLSVFSIILVFLFHPGRWYPLKNYSRRRCFATLSSSSLKAFNFNCLVKSHNPDGLIGIVTYLCKLWIYWVSA